MYLINLPPRVPGPQAPPSPLRLSRRGLIAAAGAGTATVIVGPASAALATGVVVGVQHTGIFVESVEASMHFYVDLLGLSVRSSPGPTPITSPAYLDPIFGLVGGQYRVGSVQSPGDPTFDANAHFIELFQVVAPRIGPEMRPTLRRDGQYTVSFMVDDVRRMFRRLKAAGVRTISDAPVQVERGRWAAHVCDPDNSLVEIVEPGGNLSGTLR